MTEWTQPQIVTAIIAGVGALAALLGAWRSFWSNPSWVRTFEGKLGTFEGKLGTFEGKLGQLRSDFDAFAKDVRDRLLVRFRRPLIISGSPMHLTEFGEEIAATIKAQAWADEIVPTVLVDTEGMEPHQIDAFSQERAKFNQLSAAWQNRVSECAYEVGIERDGVMSVLYVVLRDELLRLTRSHEDP